MLGATTTAIYGIPIKTNETLGAILILLTLLVYFVLLVYFFVWVYRVHREVAVFTGSAYPVTAGKAVLYFFIPIYNVYWVVHVPHRLAIEIDARLGRAVVRPKTVLAIQILSIPAGMILCVPLAFYAATMSRIQAGLNELWGRV